MSNNNLNEEQCKTFLKEYKEYKKKIITSITNPITKRILTDTKRIELIKDLCVSKYNLQSLAKSSSSQKVILNKQNINLLLRLPLIPSINVLFSKPVPNDIGFPLLEQYIENNKQSNVIIEYKEILKEIRNFIPLYDPLHWKKDEELAIFAEFNLVFKEGFNIDADTLKTNNNIKGVIKQASDYFKASIIQSDIIKTKENYKDNLIHNYNKYYALLMVLDIMMYYNTIPFIIDRINNQIKLLKILLNIDNTVIKTSDSSLSVSFSKTPSPKSSEGSVESKKYLKYILETEPKAINDTDLFTQDEWKDISESKLKFVIKIPVDKKTCYAFYIKDIYKLWYESVNTKKDFKNPFTNAIFNEKQEDMILEKMKEMYPVIKKPKLSEARKDLVLYKVDIVHYLLVKIKYVNNPIDIDLIEIRIPIKYEQQCIDGTLDFAYLPASIIEKIEKLHNRNKILGKKIPFIINPIFLKYNGKSLDNVNNYKEFCDKLEL
jgi:hypothetical protein